MARAKVSKATDDLPKWEVVSRDGKTWRLKVPGGHLYKTIDYGPGEESPVSVAMCFVSSYASMADHTVKT